MRTLIKVILPLCLLITFAGTAAAQTPDGSPPAEETVCDGQTGAAYGLCTAYCVLVRVSQSLYAGRVLRSRDRTSCLSNGAAAPKPRCDGSGDPGCM